MLQLCQSPAVALPGLIGFSPPEMDRISHLPRWPHSDLTPKVNSVRLIRLAISYVLILKQHFHTFVAPN